MRTFVLWFGLVACGGPNEATLIEELRIVAAVAEPPEAAIGETYDLTVTVADPLQLGGDWLVWSCIPELEGIPVEPGCVRQAGTLDGETFTVPAAVVGPLPVYVMACNPGKCDLPGATDAQLEDPNAWLTELPFSGVALARRFTRVAEGEERRENPVVEEVTLDKESVKTEGELTLSFVTPGAETAYGYATGGGFTMGSFDVGESGNAELVWVAPEDAGGYRLYVVFEDGEGGTVVWTSDVQVTK